MRITVTAFVLFLSSIPLASFAMAETIECGTGDVQCVIAAIHQANADSHKTIIRLAEGTYLLTTVDNTADAPNGLPVIVSPILLEGDGAGTTLARQDDAPFFRLFHVGPTGDLTLDGLTLAHGGGGNNPFRYKGGAIFNDHGTLTILDTTIALGFSRTAGGIFNAGGAVTLTRTVFDRNYGDDVGGLYTEDGVVRISGGLFTENSGGQGFAGGILAESGTITIDHTTLTRNVADGAGALVVRSEATVTMRDSAFIANRAPVTNHAAIENGGTLHITNATFAEHTGCNSFVANGGSMSLVNTTFAEHRGGVDPCITTILESRNGATTQLQNTILVHGSDHMQDCWGVVTSLGNNLIGDPTGCTISLQLTDFVGEANLGTLTDDGTPGNAHYPLLPESRAIDSANDEACPKKDQIGQPRQPRCDIGAVEFPPFGAAVP
jgi:hypothetical protein